MGTEESERRETRGPSSKVEKVRYSSSSSSAGWLVSWLTDAMLRTSRAIKPNKINHKTTMPKPEKRLCHGYQVQFSTTVPYHTKLLGSSVPGEGLFPAVLFAPPPPF